MQKNQTIKRLSTDANHTYKKDSPSSYAQGFSAGFEAGRRASLGKNTEQKITGINSQRFSDGTGYQRSQSQDNKDFSGTQQIGIKTFRNPINNDTQQKQYFGGRLDQKAQRSFDDPIIKHDGRIHTQEHEMSGKITNPETEVQFNARGHY